ncbi:phage terminase large subunit [Staphylococcus pseudintermedius]|uniref:phage terminase large subunit n=1 Tax=Staphylococcus pseudintermedius TaxID=283734 RepID=UPI002B472428|nr:phage terminase large subunit [Staphylococcus pseudintermedius]
MATNKIPHQVRDLARLELARLHYKYYLLLSHHDSFTSYAHTDLIANELQEIINGKQKHIIIEMPPRHGKSMAVTETFPSYFLTMHPNKRVITASYSDGLARKFGRLNRNKFLEFANSLNKVQIAFDNGSVNNWGILSKRGGMISTGIGGSITGQGADLMIIDDPIKNAKEAQSKTYRDNVWAEWESTLSTRLHKGASVIVIMTRWHEDDFVGRLLKGSPYNWTRLRLPAIAEKNDDLLGREIGEALCPALGYDEDWAAYKKKEVGERTWASLYQQRPSPESGSIFKRKWFSKVDSAPTQYDDMLISWDFTFKDSDKSDFVVGQVWVKKGADFYLIDQVRKRIDFTQSVKATQQLHKKYPRCRKILVEDKANGPAIINTLKRSISGIIPVTPKESKEARAYSVTPFFEANNVHFVKTVPHLDEMIEELATFPNSQNDDTVDACTQALNYFANKQASRVSSTNAW